jgi:glycosyltransferase involved in cell wall biosynthesis
MSFGLRSLLARMANAVLFYNHTNAKVFTDQGFDPRRVFVALNSLDQSIIQAARQEWLDDPARLRAWQREKGLLDKPVVLFVSRLDVNNRLGLLIDAAQHLVAWNDEVRVVIVGAGEDAENLKRRIAEKHLEKHVLMVGAVYEEKQLAPYFLSARAYCYPRNIGLSILHAFGYALPVVTGDDYKSHNPEIEALRPNENGLLYRDGDAGALATTLRTILQDPALARRMGEAAHRTVMERFSVKVMVDGFESAIRYCMSGAKK